MLRYEVDATGILDKYNMIDATLDRDPSQRVNDMGNLPTAIEGPQSLQARIRDLLLEYREIFRKEVSPVPAAVPPMMIQVDIQKWMNMRKLDHPEYSPKDGRCNQGDVYQIDGTKCSAALKSCLLQPGASSP